uniref:Ig-like domain-containing protein n=1 Tax=Denticeps clupeoides TaxID=299321 RepID=A0AAY4BTD3_9TELE
GQGSVWQQQRATHIKSKRSGFTPSSLMSQSPSVTLLQGSNELLCLVWDFSPKAVNITWLHNKKIIETHRDSDPSKGLDGKYTVLSYLKLAAESWEIGDEYMCTVTHVAGSVSASVSREGDG